MCSLLYAVLSLWIVYFTPWEKKTKTNCKLKN